MITTFRKQALFGAAGILLSLGVAQTAFAQGGDGGGSNEGIGPGGSLCDYNGDCTGGALGNRTVNRRDFAVEPDKRVVVPDRNVRRDSDRNYRREDSRRSYRDPYDVEIYVEPAYRYSPSYRAVSRTEAHIGWCYDRYRSYRERDNTYQPTRGPRRQCYSPYS